MWFENPFRNNDPDNLALLLRNLGGKQVGAFSFFPTSRYWIVLITSSTFSQLVNNMITATKM